MSAQPGARDRVLLAFEDLLIEDGERAATLDAVAAAAGVSKGGLLYHFKSREALSAGLIQKLRDLAAIDAKSMAEDPLGEAHYYVRTSVFGGTTFDRTIVAAMRLAQGHDDKVRAVFEEIHREWLELILADVGDPAVARAIMLIGDGLYYNAALFGLPADDGAAAGPHDGGSSAARDGVDALLEVVAGLKAGARK